MRIRGIGGGKLDGHDNRGRVIDIRCCIISALHQHYGLHGIFPTMTGRPLSDSWIVMGISVPCLTLAVQTHTETRFYSYIHTQSSSLYTYSHVLKIQSYS
jgi:hypothetical protein